MKEFKLFRFILLAIIIFSTPQLAIAWQGSITGPGISPQSAISPIETGATYTYSGFFEEDDVVEWVISPETAGTITFSDGGTVTIDWNGTEGGFAQLSFRQENTEESINGQGITGLNHTILATENVNFIDCPDLAGTILVSSHPDLNLGLNETITASIAQPSSFTTVEWRLIGPQITQLPFGSPVQFQIPAQQALGPHKLRAILRDDCGNSLTLEEDVIIVEACDENASLELVTQQAELCLNTGIVVELMDAFAGNYTFSTNAPGASIVTDLLANRATITFTESGSFQVTATPTNPACTESISLPIDISAPIESVEGDRTVCEGFTKIYKVNGGDYAHGVEWTLPAGVSITYLNGSNTEVALTFTYVDDLPKTITVANPDANCGNSSVDFDVEVFQQVPKVTDVTVDNTGLISNNSGSGILELTTNSCTDIYGDCGTTLSSLDAFVKFSLGADNYFSESTDALASIEIDIVALGVDDNVIFEETGVSLSLNKLEPLKVYYLPLRGADAQNVRTLKVTQAAGSYATHADIDAEKVTLQFYYEEVAEVDAALAPLELVVVPELSGAFEQTFEWSVNTAEYNCREVPGYQIQMMRLYGDQIDDDLTETDWRGATNMYSESPETNLMISIAEGSGTYAWRVRPIGSIVGNAKYALSNPANWSDEAWVAARFDFTQPEEDKNFIYSRSFTEKAKINEQLGFANGLGQVAQQQVKMHGETDQVIAVQTLQDYAGRDALTTLPVPLQDISAFGYRNALLTNGTTTYTADNFDTDPQNALDAQVFGGYYNGTKAGVASAEGIPYTRNTYANDGTGRLREQGGVGATHALTSDRANRRTIRTYYSSVEEGELVTIFGKEAPDASNVHKVITYDANNVGSVTYQDKSGRVLATAIDAGAVAGALDPLTSNPIDNGDGPRTIVGKVEGNTRTGTYQVSSQKPLFFVSEKAVTINYGITPATVDALCDVLCTSCDYKIEFLLHNQDDPSVQPVELGSHIINPVDCGSNVRVDIPAPIVTDPLEPEVNYVLERRISTHQKETDAESPNYGMYYLDVHLGEIETAYNNAVQALLNDLDTEISSGNVQDLYNRLTSEDGGYNLDLIDGEYAVPITAGTGDDQCMEYIFIPRVEDCEGLPDAECKIDGMLWEAYFQNYWTEKGEGFGMAVNGVLPYAYFVDLQKKYDEEVLSMSQNREPDETQYVFNYAPGELDQMIESLMADNSDRLSCEDIWTAWKEQVAIYKIMTESVGNVDAFGNPYAPESFEKSLINRFLVGLEVLLDSRKPEESSDPCALATDGSPTYMVKDLAYGTLGGNSFPSSATYPDLKLEAHRLVYLHDVDNPDKLAYAASLAGVDPTSFTVSNFNGLSACDKYAVYANDDVELDSDLQGQLDRTNAINTCNGWCLDRSEEFRQAVIEELIKENANYRFQHYRVVESDIVGNYIAIYDSELNSDVFDYSECEIQTMVDALVANCQANYCNLTLTDVNGDPIEMSEADILKVEQVFNYDFELNLNTSGASCTSGYDQVDTDLSIEGPSAFTQLWTVNDLDANCSIEQQVMSTFDDFGNIYAVLVPRYGEFNYTLNNGTVINDPYGEGAFAVVKFNGDGVYQWHKQYTFELQDQIFYQTPPSIPAPVTLPGFEPANVPALPGNLSLTINEDGDVSFVVNVYSRDALVATSETWQLFDQNNNLVLEFITTSKTPETSCSNDFVSNAITATLTDAGAVRWFKRYDASGSNFNTVDTQGNAYVLRSDKLPVSIEKIAPNGNVLWVSETVFQSGVAQATAKTGEISVDPSGNTYFYNEFTTTANTVSLTVSGQTVATLPANSTTAVVVRYDSNGHFSWVYTLPAGSTGFTRVLARADHVLIVGNQGTELDVREVYSPLLVTQHTLTGIPTLGSISLWALAGNELAVYSNSIVSGGVNSLIVSLDDYSFSTDFDLSPSKFVNVTDAYFEGANKLYIGTSKSISEVNDVNISAGGWLAPAHASGFLCGITSQSSTGNTRVEDPRFCFKWTTERPFDLPGDDIIAFDPQLPDLCSPFTMDEILQKIETQRLTLIYRKQAAFKEAYDSRCVDPELFSDDFTVTYTTDLHHYTLYYYDRLGNLISTVPPEGVVQLDVHDPSSLETAKGLLPVHTFRTTYQYNSLGQLVSQQNPDAGNTKFIYNDIGQLRFSQNAQQAIDGTYKYVHYDNLGRVVEQGLATGDFSITALANSNNLSWPTSGTEITRTVYSLPYNGDLPGGYNQSAFLRNRISYMYIDQDGVDDPENNDRTATIYNYDPQGNLEWVVQDIPGLGPKTIDYQYDVLSGNVLMVAYNKNDQDRFYHRYEYDLDNRITGVETSIDGVIWDRDAAYNYHDHGPLKQTLFGQDIVQQMDYLYTINGWLKAINDPDSPLEAESSITRDAFAMILHYYSGDYIHSSGSVGRLTALASTADPDTRRDLYNGNISARENANQNKTGVWTRSGMQYSYDILDRIKTSTFNVHRKEVNDEGQVTMDDFFQRKSFATNYTYNGNGNLLTLDRDDLDGEHMDQLVYNMEVGKNRLSSVTDESTIAPEKHLGDIEGINDYQYDALGNLIQDLGTGTGIDWTVYGKVNTTINANGSYTNFTYDAAGNRVAKQNTDVSGNVTTDYYVRDADGNVMAIYRGNGSQIEGDVPIFEVPIYGTERIGVHRPGEISEAAVPDSYVTIDGDYELSEWEGVSNYYLAPTGSFRLLPGFDNGGEAFTISGSIETAGNIFTRALDSKLYELTDHLGNVRATISDVKKKAPEGEEGFISTIVNSSDYYPFGMDRTPVVWEDVIYLATFETDNTSFEQTYFNNRDNIQIVTSSDYNVTVPTDTYDKAQRLSSAEGKIIGLGKQLKVQAGDKINMEVYGKYVSGSNNDPVVIGSNLAGALLTGFGAPAGELHPGAASTLESEFGSGSIFAYNGTPGGVRAYLNYVFLDENYTLVTGGYAPLEDNSANPDLFQQLTLEYIPDQDGYLFVYLSDESERATEVFFDDFMVTHEMLITDPQLEAYRYGFNGKEKDSKGEFGLNHYDYGFRIYNPAIAKFLSVDPLTDSYPWYTPYQFAGNSPISFIDLDGLEPSKAQLYWVKQPKMKARLGDRYPKKTIFYITEGRNGAGEIEQPLIVKQDYSEGASKYAWYNSTRKMWQAFDPHKIGANAKQVRDFTVGTLAITGGSLGVAVILEYGGAYALKQGGSYLYTHALKKIVFNKGWKIAYNAGTDFVAQLMIKGGDIGEVDFANVVISGLIKSSHLKNALSSIIDISIDNNGRFWEKEGLDMFYEMVIRTAADGIFDKIKDHYKGSINFDAPLDKLWLDVLKKRVRQLAKDDLYELIGRDPNKNKAEN